MDAIQLLEKGLPWAVAVLGSIPGVVAILRQRAAARRDTRRDRNDLLKIAQEVYGEMLEDLRGEVKRSNEERDQLRQRVDEVERELSEFRKRHDDMIADKDAMIRRLQGELDLEKGEARQWKAIAERYERLLEANAIPHPKPGQPVWQAKEEGLLLANPADDQSIGAGR